MGVGRGDAGKDVLGDALGLQVGMADARDELRQRHQPHIQRQRLGEPLHYVYHLAARRPLLRSPTTCAIRCFGFKFGLIIHHGCECTVERTSADIQQSHSQQQEPLKYGGGWFNTDPSARDSQMWRRVVQQKKSVTLTQQRAIVTTT